MAGARKTAKTVLDEFKTVLKETATTFKKPMSEVTLSQFILISNGRLGAAILGRYGGFTVLREYFAPSSKTKAKTEAVLMLERILKNVKAA